MAETININLENLTEKEKAQLFELLAKGKHLVLSKVENGETFKIGDIEFIKFTDIDGVTTAVTKEAVFNSDYGNNNNLANRKILDRLEKEFMPKITAAVGEENILDFETDLTTLDGVKTYGKITSKVSLPTLDFYREHTEIFDKYKLGGWYWLATPLSALPHYDSACILCVAPSGFISNGFYDFNYGVRPILHFKSSIFDSCED